MIPSIKTHNAKDTFVMQIPICCQEGHPDCPHVAKKQKQLRGNIGL